MQIRYCESCGVKLSDADGVNGLTFCTMCKNTIAHLPDVPVVPRKPVSRKSSATRLPALGAVGTTTGSASTEDGKTPSNMSFYFCEACGKRVTEVDVAAGRARNKQVRGVYCRSCADGVMTMTFDAITQEEMSRVETLRRQGKQSPSQCSRLMAPKSSHVIGSACETTAHRYRNRTDNPKTLAFVVAIGCVAATSVLITLVSFSKKTQALSTKQEMPVSALHADAAMPPPQVHTQLSENLDTKKAGETKIDVEGGKRQFAVADRNLAQSPIALDTNREKLDAVAKSVSETPTTAQTEKVHSALVPPDQPQIEPSSRTLKTTSNQSASTLAARTANTPFAVDTGRAAYAVWLKSFHALWAGRNWNGAKESIAKARKNPLLKSQAESFKVVEDCIMLVELAEKATVQGAKALKDGRPFTLESSKKKDRIDLGRKVKIIKVDETAILIEQNVGVGKVEFNLPFAELTAETRFALARIGIPESGQGKLALALLRFSDCVKQGSDDPALFELLSQARSAHGPSSELRQLENWLTMIDREKKASEGFAFVEMSISSGNFNEAHKALENFIAEFSDTAVLFENANKFSEMKRRIEALNIQPGLLASYYSGTVEDHRKKFHLSIPIMTLEQDHGRRDPSPGVPIDMFDMELNGFLRIQEPGSYTFILIGDDTLDVWLDGKKIGSAQWDRQARVNVSLTIGDHAFKAVHGNNVSDARFNIRWTRPGRQSEEAIPANVLFHSPQ